MNLVLIRMADGQVERNHDLPYLAFLLKVSEADLKWSVSTFGEYYNADYILMADWQAQRYARCEHMKETRH